MRRDPLAWPVVGAGLALAALLTSGSAAALDPTIPAPVTRLSADGRTTTDGQRTLSASIVVGLDPGGQRIELSGSGYDTFKGIYVAFCVVPPTNQAPTPCGGGADTSGTSGASHWISSNPPPQGDGVAEPYGPGGSFRVSNAVAPMIGPPGGKPIDCRRVRCAVVTRNDHTRSTDRGQDIFVPVSFAARGAATTVPSTTVPATTAPPTSVIAVPEPTAPTAVDPTTTTSAEQTTDTDPTEVAGAPIADTASGSSSPAGLLVLVLGAAALAAAVVVSLVVRARRSTAP